MSDEELRKFLVLTAEEAAIILPKLSPERRAFYERAAAIVDAIKRGERPEGVIVCG